MELQRKFDELYEAFHVGWIGRERYAEAVDELGRLHPDAVSRLMGRRRDVRTLGEFALSIYDLTHRERLLMGACWPRFAEPGWTYEDYGLANDGRLIVSVGERVGGLDFKVVREDETWFPLEIKFCPTQKYLTYKVDDLNHYLRTPDARVLTVATPDVGKKTGKKSGEASYDRLTLPHGSWMTVFDHESVARIFKYGEGGNHWGFGGKPTVRINARDFHRIAETVPIEHEPHGD